MTGFASGHPALRPRHETEHPRGRIPVDNDNSTRVVVTDIRMPFWSMVVFMVKWAIAAIPAMLILIIFWFIIMALFSGMGSMMRMHM